MTNEGMRMRDLYFWQREVGRRSYGLMLYLQNCIKRFNVENQEKPIRKFEPHICRHTFATNMQGLPPKTLQYILGHSNISTTMNHYVDAKPSEQQLVEINALANAISA